PADWEKDQSWYYFRLLEPDFTPLPVYEALVDNTQTGQEPEQLAGWVVAWNSLRPFLFFAGTALFFFGLLWWLVPKET
ncbi:MAG: hypothetical protein JSV68_03095, partial [Anaerolineaceae bacterium]